MRPVKFRTIVLSKVIFWAITMIVFLGMCVLILKIGDALGMHRVLTEGMITVIFGWIVVASGVSQYKKSEAVNEMVARLTLVERNLELLLKQITPTSSYSEGMHDGVKEALDYIKEIKGENE